MLKVNIMWTVIKKSNHYSMCMLSQNRINLYLIVSMYILPFIYVLSNTKSYSLT